MKNIISISILSLLCLILQTTVLAKVALLFKDIFLINILFQGIYINMVVIVLSYTALTRKPYESLMWSLFLFSMTNAFGVAWGSSLSISYILITMLCLSFRHSIFISGFVQKFFFGFLLCLVTVLIEHLVGGIFERKSEMFSGLFMSIFSQSLMSGLIAPFLLNVLVWIDRKTLPKMQLQNLNVIFSQQRDGFIATF